MEDMIPCSLKDQEVFQRVWQRVMAGRPEADCPIQSGPSGWEGDLSCQCLEDLMHRRGEGVSPACARWEEQSQPEGPEETAPPRRKLLPRRSPPRSRPARAADLRRACRKRRAPTATTTCPACGRSLNPLTTGPPACAAM